MKFRYVTITLFLCACGGGSETTLSNASGVLPNNSAFATQGGATSAGGIFTRAEFGGLGSGYPTDNTLIDFEDYKLTAAFRVAEWAIVASAPIAGSADMTGYMTIDTASDQKLIGNMNMSADFAAGTVTGQAADFSRLVITPTTISFAETLNGALNVSNGTIIGSNVLSDISGQLSGNSTYDVTGSTQARLYYDLGSEYTVWASQDLGKVTNRFLLGAWTLCVCSLKRLGLSRTVGAAATQAT